MYGLLITDSYVTTVVLPASRETQSWSKKNIGRLRVRYMEGSPSLNLTTIGINASRAVIYSIDRNLTLDDYHNWIDNGADFRIDCN